MKRFLAIIIIILVLLFLYGKYIEVNNIKVNNYNIESELIPDTFKELKIVHFSDILYKSGTNIDKYIELINDEDADIVIFTGDLLVNNSKYNKEDYIYLEELFSKINVSLYKYAIIGNNDTKHLENYKDILSKSEFILLNNENINLYYKDITPINIIGINDLSNINELVDDSLFNLVITHKPGYFDKLKEYNIEYILCGHSLGGIIKAPYYGGIINLKGTNGYINDTYTSNNTTMYVSNGLGYYKYNYRLFNTPSINVYKIK